ncbi:hypothetical protein F8C76_15740 [Flagellimonas olearia]|uniref:Uncharacterized protein n=1 Tax=Flagellimonas olearia TaxID=552546 RepID=A0A6I1DWB6_9FLAO|nr:hypothetical protein [Allomuricauda olearia]KAB7529280.1 hypothetical protein F8C76_15740 [Allomuricauda olearia]
MLKESLHTFKMLKRIENPSPEVQDSLDFLGQSIKDKARDSIHDLMYIGDVIGYDELQDSLKEMVNFLKKMKNKPQ